MAEPARVEITDSATFNVLVAIDRAQIATDRKSVMLPGLMTAQIPLLPRRTEGANTWEHEVEIARAFGQKKGVDSPRALYATEIFSDEFFRVRRETSA
ncbi:MAG: hypothetical protein H7305_03855 [Gemmatimonadaceae bacterium]|nr:hypothetical protein [Gemmatimonadaceae bacterium]